MDQYHAKPADSNHAVPVIPTGPVTSSAAASTRSKSESRSSQQPGGNWFTRRGRHDDRYDYFVTRSLEDYPQGYSRLAALVDSDVDSLLFRRFGWLRCRAMLHVQDELSVLEQRLMDLDRQHEKQAPHRLISRRIDEAMVPGDTFYTRATLINEIKAKLKEYDDLVSRQNTVSSMPKPTKANFISYFDWIYNDPPVVREEFDFVYHKDDFMSLGQETDTWIGPITDALSLMLPSRLQEFLFTSKADRAKTNDPNTTYYSDSRWETMVKILVNVVSIMLLVLPTVLLYLLNISRGEKLAILVVFVTVFNISLSALTRAKRHEIFGASAAYCAVLVVFLGTISPPASSQA